MASYVDIAVLSFVGLAFAVLLLVCAKTFKRAMWYLLKWSVAFIVLSSLVSLLDHVPVYGVLRDAAYGAIRRTVFSNAKAQEATFAAELWNVFKQQVRTLATETIKKKTEL